jgi:hypothetical protein
MSDDRYVWLASVEQEIGKPVVIPAETRLLAEEHAETFTEDEYGKRLGRWYESPGDDGSLISFSEDNEIQAIVSRQRIRSEYPDGRSPEEQTVAANE